MDDAVVLGPHGQIPAGDVRWLFTPSGGPGGQHANRANTRAEARVDLRSCRGLSPRTRARLLDAFGPTISVTVDDTRSQHRNRQVALERLGSQLRSALRPESSRRPTRPSRAATRRRLESKRRQSAKKRLRGRPHPED